MENFVRFTCASITTKLNDKGVEKKQLKGLPKKWTENINKDNYKDYIFGGHKGMCVICGEINGITVVDFDNVSTYEKALEQFPDLKNYKTVKTKRGFHVYCKYNPYLKTRSDACVKLEGIDIANDGHMILAPPSYYIDLEGNEIVYTDLGGEILDVPQFIIDDLKQNQKVKTEKVKKEKVKKEFIIVDDETEDETDETTEKKGEKINQEELQTLLDMIILNEKEKKDRNLWMTICACIKYNGLPEKSWIKFYKDQELNDDIEKQNLYKNLSPYPIEKFYLQSLASKSNPDKYSEYQKIYVTDKTKKRVGNTDADCADLLFNDLKDIFVSYKGRLFYKLDNVWICDENKIKDLVIYYILHKSNIYSVGLTGWIPIHKSLRNATTMYETLLNKILNENEDINLYRKLHETTINRLCFNDGVLDFVAKKFYTWEEIKTEKIEIYTTNKINKKFKSYFENPNREIMNEIKNKIFYTSYGDKTDTALHFLSRALTANYGDKRFGTYLGNRNSGKGVKYELLKYAFEDYVRSFELGNILYCRKTAGQENIDCSKKLYWLLDLEFVRLAISQEVPESNSGLVANGKILKKISGGEDDMIARRNYDRRDTHFKIETTFYMEGNSGIIFDAEDCSETQVEFHSVIQFKSQEEIDFIKNQKLEKIKNMIDEKVSQELINKQKELDDLEMNRYRKADDSLKNKCKTLDWSLATIMLIYENYKDYKIPINKQIDADDNLLINVINEKFEITNKLTDCELCADIYAILNNYDKKKITNELQAMNVFKKKNLSTGDKRQKMCFFGIKIKLEKEDNDI